MRPGPWSWSRASPRFAEVRVEPARGVVFEARVDLDGAPLGLPVSIPLMSVPSSTAPATSWVDELRARVETAAIDVTIGLDRLDVTLPLEGAPIDWRMLLGLVEALQAMGRSGRAAWLGPQEAVTPARDCPSCGAPLRRRAGAHLEDQCVSCHGTFFEGGVAATVLQERFGLSPADVLAAANAEGVGGACPACRRPLRPVLIDEVIGDVCAGCGGVWLDPGEREALLP